MHPLIRRTHVPFAVFCVGLFLWGQSVSLGWLPYGRGVQRSSVLFWGALAAYSLSFVAGRRSANLEVGLIVVALLLMGWTTLELAQGR